MKPATPFESRSGVLVVAEAAWSALDPEAVIPPSRKRRVDRSLC